MHAPSHPRFRAFVLALGIAAGTALAAPSSVAQTHEDPLEGFNRGVFAVNQVIDGAFLEPAAMGYRFFVPEYGRDRVGDVLRNLAEPVRFVNALLQGDPDAAGNTLGRFFINSTLGLGGLFDVAAHLEPPYDREVERGREFGVTLGKWGWEESTYLVLPLFGPSTVRDGIGLGLDAVSTPWFWVFPSEASWAVTGVGVVHVRESVLDQLDDLERSSLDFYASLRSIYLQRRDFLIRGEGAEVPADIFDEFEDELY
ncbi:MAG: VacJ family lipoprotein [Pseudomonadota bacterium]